MNYASVTFKALSPDAVAPRRQTAGSAGYDIYTISAGSIAPHMTASISLGFSLDLPRNYCALLLGRSGLAVKNGLEIKLSPVTSNKEVFLSIHNNSDAPFIYDKATRIGQLLFAIIDADSIFVAGR